MKLNSCYLGIFFLLLPEVRLNAAQEITLVQEGKTSYVIMLPAEATANEYLAKSRLWLRYAKIAQDPRAGPEFEKFMSDVRKLGITQLREGQSLEVWEKAYLERARRSGH